MKHFKSIATLTLLVSCQSPVQAPEIVGSVETDVTISLSASWSQGMSAEGADAYIDAQTAIVTTRTLAITSLQNQLKVGAIDSAEYSTGVTAANQKETADLAALEVRKATEKWWAPARLLLGYSNSGTSTYGGISALLEYQTVDASWHSSSVKLPSMVAKSALTDFYDLSTAGNYIKAVRYAGLVKTTL